MRGRLLTAPAAFVGVLLAAVCAASLAAGERLTWSFSDVAPGGRPPGFTVVSTGLSGDGRWEVLREGGEHVLAQLAPSSARGYRVALAPGSLRDLTLSVRLKAEDGDRAAGIVWRYQDDGRYYLARVELGQQTVALYRVVAGNRSRLESEDDLELDAAAWHTLKIEHRGELIRLWVNGVPVERARDRAIADPGRVGVWVTARSAARFDDLTAVRIDR